MRMGSLKGDFARLVHELDGYARFDEALSSTGTKSALDPAALWLRNCKSDHDSCRYEGQDQPTLPTRVIDVGESSSVHSPRLLETNGMRGEYLTLSYCWGKAGNFTTSSENYKSLLEKIPEENLPRTIREAIAVTKALGQRYLWIDAICIIQDSTEDKLREITIMDQIYQKSTLTIAAAKGDSAQAGLFAQRDLRRRWPAPMSEAFKEGMPADDGDFIFRTAKKSRYGLHELDTRGWILQESTLSRRLLIFGPERLEWCCLADWVSEEHPETWNQSAHYNQSSGIDNIHNFRRWLGIQKLREDDRRLREVYYDWTLAVGNYSSRFLSVERDKLPAIGGAARAMSQICPMTYVAGLWREDFHNGLTWFVESRAGYDFGRGTRTADSIAPSWSWASRHAPVNFYHQSIIYGPLILLVEVQDVRIEPALGYHDAFGEVKDAKMRLLGCMKEVHVVRRSPAEDEPSRNIPSHQRFAFAISVDDLESAQEIGYIAYDEEPLEGRTVVSCVPIIVLRSPSPKALLCLGLVRDEARTSGYRRVGLIVILDLEYFGDTSGDQFTNSRKIIAVF